MQQDELFRQFVEQIQDYAVFVIGRDGRALSWNQGVERVLGYCEREFIGLDCALLFVPEDRASGVPARELAEAEAVGSANNDRRMLRKDGSRVWVLGRTSRIVDDEGKIIAFGKVMRDRTDLKRAEEALRENEARYSSLIDSVADGIITIDSESTILFANPGAERIFGYEAAEMVGQDLTMLMPEYLRHVHRVGFTRYLQTGVRHLDWLAIELPGLHRAGHELPLEVSFGESRSEGSRTFTGVVRDVSERRKAEQSLRDSERRARALVEQSALPMLVFDADGHPVTANSAWERTWGLTLADAPPEYTVLADSQLEAQGYLPVVRRAFAGEVVTLPAVYYDVSQTAISGLGAAMWVEGHFSPITDADGRVTQVVLTQVDITERKRTEDALRESEARTRLATEAAQLGLWELDVQNLEAWHSLRHDQIFGYAGALPRWTYEQFLSHVHTDDRARVDAKFRLALSTGEDVELECRIVRADGQTRWIWFRGSFYPGAVTRMFGGVRDITERRQSDEMLQQAQRLESIGRLAGGVAHEANNQMSVVLGCAEFVLNRSDVPEAVRADVEQIREAAERTAAITAQLLAYGRRQVLQLKMLDLNEIVTGLEPILRRTLGDVGMLLVNLSSGLGLVKADAGQLAQILLNLVLNARDALSPGGTVAIKTRPIDLRHPLSTGAPDRGVPPGEYAALLVTDNGHGMTPETLQHIFEPFFTTKRVGKGTGLGLSTVYGIVRQSGGYVWAESEPNVGTTFKLYFPVAQPELEAKGVEFQPGAGRAAETLLVVEDEVAVRKIMARTLRELGYGVLEASNGGEALELAEAQPGLIALAIIDVSLPGMNGLEVAAHLLKIEPGLPTLFVSGYPGEEVAHHGWMEEGQRFLQKPVTPKLLATEVQELLTRKRSRKSLST